MSGHGGQFAQEAIGDASGHRQLVLAFELLIAAVVAWSSVPETLIWP